MEQERSRRASAGLGKRAREVRRRSVRDGGSGSGSGSGDDGFGVMDECGVALLYSPGLGTGPFLRGRDEGGPLLKHSRLVCDLPALLDRACTPAMDAP